MLTINGAEMPSPSEMTVTLADRGETSAINALGQRVADRMAVKRVVHLTWALLTCTVGMTTMRLIWKRGDHTHTT